ncbi:MAG TPA: hypothetical protein G4O11_11830 [Anaerolineae bacterium]|nr:hypothetical protein [Anaerolineae bacterium]
MTDLLKNECRIFLGAVALVITTHACSPTAGVTPTDITPSTPPSVTPKPRAIPTETTTSIPASGSWLSPDGPWWVISTEDGIWAVNRDGSELTQIIDQTIPPMNAFREAPSGGMLAYVTWNPVSEEETLYILKLPDGAVTEVASLSAAVGPILQGDPLFEARTLIASMDSVAWSPDGQRLAFVGFMDGPSPDLYVYAMHDGSLTRLTDGTVPILWPIWSPDGEYILFFGVPGLVTGEGPGVASVWFARADGSEVRKLYDASGEGTEVVIGWVDDRHFVTYSSAWTPVNLRIVDVETGPVDLLWEDYFNTADLDQETGVLLLGLQRSTAERNPDGKQGLYIIQAGGPPPWRMIEDEPYEILWSIEAGLFFAETEFGILAVSSTGNYIDLDRPASSTGFPIVAPGTRELAWTGSELWIGSLTSSIENPPRQVFIEPTYCGTWGTQGRNLLFFSTSGLYMATGPDFGPVLLGKGLSCNDAVWVKR